jgi:hypothetical protein
MIVTTTATIIATHFAYIGKGVLAYFGISHAGPVAGTVAATYQAAQGGTLVSMAAGGIFATLQSAAMGGATAVASAIGVGVFTVFVGSAWLATKLG